MIERYSDGIPSQTGPPTHKTRPKDIQTATKKVRTIDTVAVVTRTVYLNTFFAQILTTTEVNNSYQEIYVHETLRET